MTIRPYQSKDRSEWVRMRIALWPDIGDPQEQQEDADRWLARPDATVLVAEAEQGSLCGFAEAGERPYADGCDSTPIAFLEAWYVDPDHRNQHIGIALVTATEQWAHTRGLTELASDTLLDNTTGIAAHLSAGFIEVERSVKFHKSL